MQNSEVLLKIFATHAVTTLTESFERIETLELSTTPGKKASTVGRSRYDVAHWKADSRSRRASRPPPGPSPCFWLSTTRDKAVRVRAAGDGCGAMFFLVWSKIHQLFAYFLQLWSKIHQFDEHFFGISASCTEKIKKSPRLYNFLGVRNEYFLK